MIYISQNPSNNEYRAGAERKEVNSNVEEEPDMDIAGRLLLTNIFVVAATFGLVLPEKSF